MYCKRSKNCDRWLLIACFVANQPGRHKGGIVATDIWLFLKFVHIRLSSQAEGHISLEVVSCDKKEASKANVPRGGEEGGDERGSHLGVISSQTVC